MGIGVSVFLIAVGAVLAFAVNAVVPHVDLVLVGVILMVAGVIGFLMSLLVWGPRHRAVTTTTSAVPTAAVPTTAVRTAPVVQETVDRPVY